MGKNASIAPEQRRKHAANSSASTWPLVPNRPELTPTVQMMLQLQRTIGNRAVTALVQRYQSQLASSPVHARAANTRAASPGLIQRCFGEIHPGCSCSEEPEGTVDAGDTSSDPGVPAAGSIPFASALPVERSIVGGTTSDPHVRERPAYGSVADLAGVEIHLGSHGDAPAVERNSSSSGSSQPQGTNHHTLARLRSGSAVQRQDDDQGQMASGEVSDAGVPFEVSGAVSGAAAAASGGSDAGTAPSDQSQTADNQGPTAAASDQQPDTSQQGGTPSSNSGAGPAGSPAYQQGYQDGVNGNPPQPAPWDGQAADDYQEGYDKGHYELTQQTSSPSGVPSGPNASQGPAFTPAPTGVSDTGPNQSDATDDDQAAYQLGYQDGQSGSLNDPANRVGPQYAADYQSGYTAGQQAAVKQGSAQSPAPAPAPESGPNESVALQQDQEAYQAGYQDGKSGASYNYLGHNLGIGYEADYQNGFNDGQQAGGNIPQAGSSAPSDQTSIGPETPDQQKGLAQQKSLNESIQVCERRPPEFRDMCLRNLAGMPYSSWGGRAPKVYEPYE